LLDSFLDKRESVARGHADPYPPGSADDPASRPLEYGTDSAEGGHLGGLANQGVTQKLDQVFPCTECGSAAENSGPRRQESRRSLLTLEQVARVCKVAGLAAVRSGTTVPRVPVAEAA
jgi:hypothetical protein